MMVAVSLTVSGRAIDGGGTRRAGRWSVVAALVVIAVTLAVVILDVFDAARIASPPRSNLRFHNGALQVFAVANGDVLDAAGVQVDDRIIAVDGHRLEDTLAFADQFRALRSGDRMRLTVVRGGATVDLEAVTWPNLDRVRLVTALVPVIVLLVMGTGVFALRPRHPAVLLLLLYCATTAVNNLSQLTMVAGSGVLERLMTAAYTLFSIQSPAILLALFLVFPERGGLQRRLGWYLPLAVGIQSALGLAYWLPTVAPATVEVLADPRLHRLLFHAFGANVVVCYALGAISLAQVARGGSLRRTRAQGRILFFGVALLTVLQLGLHEVPLRLTGRTLLPPVAYTLVDLVIPAFVALAILFYRLFDIDVLVRQGLIYGSASVAVAAVFVAGVAALGRLAEAVFDRPSSVVIAASAAIAALLFQPLQRRSQDWVDRAFYRRHYSFRRLLAELSEQLGAIWDLDAAALLLATRIEEALAPATVVVAVARRPPGVLEAVGSHEPVVLCAADETEAVLEAVGRRRGPFAPTPEDPSVLQAAALVVPLAHGSEVLGALIVGPRRSELPYVAADREFLATVGHLAARVIENALLLEERAARERLAMVGSATSAIAHELKNPLAAIKSTAAILRRRLKDDERGRELTRVVEDEVDRLQKSLLEVLTFVRTATRERLPVAVDELVAQLVAVVSDELASSGVRVELSLGGSSPVIWADAERLRQAVLNLLLNARDAMPRGGVVTVTVEGLSAGIALEVVDDGPGFGSEALERACEPFFTTKRLGTGLGLANVRRIVEEHGGRVVICNRSPAGAVVRLELPIASSPPGREHDEPAAT